MSKKLLTDVAGILAELGVTYQQAEDVAESIKQHFAGEDDIEDFVNLASNATSVGECGC
jgi:hypothetical protein